MENKPPRRPRRTSEDWAALIEQASRSTLTQSEFCKANDICPQTFYANKRRAKIANTSGFTPVTIQSPQNVPYIDITCLEIVMKNGRSLKITGRFSGPDSLHHFIAVAEGQSS